MCLGICASKWRILDKAIETKVDTALEIVKCIALLYSIIIDIEGLRDLSSNDVAAWMLMTVISLKIPEYITLSPLLQNKRETYFVDISTVQLVLYRGKRKLLEMCSNSKSSLHYVITLTQFSIPVHKFVYKPITNAL